MPAKTEKPSFEELSALKASAQVVYFCTQTSGVTEYHFGKITQLQDLSKIGAGIVITLENNKGKTVPLTTNFITCWSDTEDITSSFIALVFGNNERNIALFNQLKSKFQRVNSAHFDEFQTRDTEKFFLDHAMKISLLVQIMGESAFKWMSDQLAQTVLPLERLLDGIPEKFPEEILLSLKQFFEQNRQIILTKDGLADWKNIIIGISTQLEHNKLSSGRNAAEQLRVYQSFAGNIKQFSESVNNGLLDSIYDALNLSVEARSQIDRRKLFEAIPPDQFAALARAKKSMGNSDPDMAILEELINCYLTGQSINDFLHNPHQTSEVGVALAAHNANIRSILTDKSINPELALRYPKTYEFSYIPSGFEIEYDRSQAARALHAVLSDLREKAVLAKANTADVKPISQFDGIIRGLDRLLEIDMKTGKLKIDPQKFYEQQNLGILEAIKKNINALENNETIKKIAYQEFLALSAEFTKKFEHVSAQKTIATASSKSATGHPAHFRIEQWDKEKINTLFLGNEVDCCLAAGSGAFYAIVQRIMDDAMLFHVVVDLETQKPIALTWLYLATDQNGDINLVGNFVEIKAKYGANEEARETIINALMHYSGEMYCRDNPGVKGLIINELTYGWNAGKIQFKEKPVALTDKVGGAFSPDLTAEERAQRGKALTCDRYYLNSLQRTTDCWSMVEDYTDGSAVHFHVYDPKQLTAEQRQKFSSVEEKIFQVVHKHAAHQRKLNLEISNEELIRIIDPLVHGEILRKMGAFFNGASPEKLSLILDYAYRVVIFGEPLNELPLFSPNIDALYPDRVTVNPAGQAVIPSSEQPMDRDIMPVDQREIHTIEKKPAVAKLLVTHGVFTSAAASGSTAQVDQKTTDEKPGKAP